MSVELVQTCKATFMTLSTKIRRIDSSKVVFWRGLVAQKRVFLKFRSRIRENVFLQTTTDNIDAWLLAT